MPTCEFCQDAHDDYECKHFSCCQGCMEEDKMTHYYYQCFYCILEGEPFIDEWDTWKETAFRSKNIILQGMKDALAGKKAVVGPYPEGKKNDNLYFSKLYMQGVVIGDIFLTKDFEFAEKALTDSINYNPYND